MISDSEARRDARRFRFPVRLCTATLAAALVVAALPEKSAFAQAQDSSTHTRATARELALQGAQAFDRGEWLQALDMFNRAYSLYPAPTISIMQARALAKLGRLLEAVDKYEQTMRTKLDADASDAYKAALTDAASEVETLRVRLPRVKLSVSGPGADSDYLRLIVDGKETPNALLGVDRPIDPGKHEFTVETPEGATGTRKLRVEEGRSYTVELTLKAPVTAPSPPPVSVDPGPITTPKRKPNRTLAYVALGVGGAGVAVGAITGIIALGKKSDLDDMCTINGSGCPPRAEDDVDSFRLNRTLSYVGFGVGAVGLIGGSVLLLTTGKAEASTQVRAYVTPGSAGVYGAF